MKMNTMVEYLYRDCDNFKQHEVAVLPGALAEEQITAVKTKLEKLSGENQDFNWFIPEQIGLCSLQERMPSEVNPDVDDVWHELEAITITPAAANHTMTAEEFYKRVMGMRKWDEQTAHEEVFG